MGPTKLKVSIIGPGSQGLVWAQNLKDSGHDVVAYSRAPSGLQRPLGAVEEGSDFVALLTPDHTHGEVLGAYAHLWPTDAPIVLAHGHSYMAQGLKEKFPQHTFVLLAPKAIAGKLREGFIEGQALFAAVDRSPPDREKFQQLLKGLGITHPIPTDFSQEAVADQFSEQALLCGLLPQVAMACFQTLVKKGIPPELAYVECWHEIKLVAQTMADQGPVGLAKLISPNALLGAKHFTENLFPKKLFQDLLETVYYFNASGQFNQFLEKTPMDQARQKIIEEWEKGPIENMFQKLHHAHD